MSPYVPKAELLRSLGQLVRGLSTLFWGLPLALVVSVQTSKGDWFREFGLLPTLVSSGLLCYGLLLLGSFQKQERVWRAALDRALTLGLLNFGLSPFLFWATRVPNVHFFQTALKVLTFSGLLFLLALNPVLNRLAAMLPDETMRAETKLFTALNRYFILGIVVLVACHHLLQRIDPLPAFALITDVLRQSLWPALFLVLLPVAMTMALAWKIKEVILASVFSPGEH